MATSVINNSAIELKLPPEILGPGSEYEERRVALRKDWQPVVEAAKKLQVVDGESCEEATRLGRLLQASGTEVTAFYKPIKVQIDALKKPVLAAENEDAAAIDEQKRQLGSQITTYNQKQQAIRDEQERVAREAAEKQAREDALNRAIELEQAGQLEQSAAVLEETVYAPAVVIQSTAPQKPRGQVGKTTYKARVDDAMKLIKAISEGKVPMAAIEINQGWLDRRADADKEAFNLPGCSLLKSQGTHFRA